MTWLFNGRGIKFCCQVWSKCHKHLQWILGFRMPDVSEGGQSVFGLGGGQSAVWGGQSNLWRGSECSLGGSECGWGGSECSLGGQSVCVVGGVA